MIITNGIIFCDDGIFRQTDIEARNGIITSIGEGLSDVCRDTFDARGCYVIPGLVDIHIHGAAGADFCDGSSRSIECIARFLLQHGVTGFLGTSMALPEERLSDIYTAARSFVGQPFSSQAILQGINMEGPFFNVKKRGAQNEKYITGADYEMFMRLYAASGSNIKTVAVAPEVEGALAFIGKARLLCNVSIAHTCADYDTACSAFAEGANHVTHLFNGMSGFLHREPGIVGAAADYDAFVEVICDGLHIHPSMVRAIFKIFSDDRVCLISDAMCACGMPDGRYELGGQTVTVANGSATIGNGSLAGSVVVLSECMRRAVEFGVPLEKALKAATINPAKAVGLDGTIGSLSVGKRADILVLDRDLKLRNVVFNGEIIK